MRPTNQWTLVRNSDSFIKLSFYFRRASIRFRPTSDTVLHCQATSLIFVQFGSNGFPVFNTPYAKWISFRMPRRWLTSLICRAFVMDSSKFWKSSCIWGRWLPENKAPYEAAHSRFLTNKFARAPMFPNVVRTVGARCRRQLDGRFYIVWYWQSQREEAR